MARKKRTQSPFQEPQFMIIPMIDIIFFLLVFFMLSTLYMVQQNVISVQLPQAAHSQYDKKKSLNVTITSQGNLVVDQDELPMDLLYRRIQIEVQKNAEQVFILRGDKEIKYELVIRALDEMKAAGAKNISIATEKKKRTEGNG